MKVLGKDSVNVCDVNFSVFVVNVANSTAVSLFGMDTSSFISSGQLWDWSGWWVCQFNTRGE